MDSANASGASMFASASGNNFFAMASIPPPAPAANSQQGFVNVDGNVIFGGVSVPAPNSTPGSPLQQCVLPHGTTLGVAARQPYTMQGYIVSPNVPQLKVSGSFI